MRRHAGSRRVPRPRLLRCRHDAARQLETHAQVLSTAVDPPPLVTELEGHRKFCCASPAIQWIQYRPAWRRPPTHPFQPASLIVCATIDVDRLSGDEDSILTD